MENTTCPRMIQRTQIEYSEKYQDEQVTLEEWVCDLIDFETVHLCMSGISKGKNGYISFCNFASALNDWICIYLCVVFSKGTLALNH